MNTSALSVEEKLVIENLRLKIQLAEMQRDSASRQLAVFVQDMGRKYSVPALSVLEPTAQATKLDTKSTRVLSQAEADALAKK